MSPSGAPALIVRELLEGQFELIVSPAFSAELEAVLRRPKFRRWVAESDIEEFMDLIRRTAVSKPDPPGEQGLTPDPRDDCLVSLARSAAADVLVSGDSHLAELANPHPPVLTPSAFLHALKS